MEEAGSQWPIMFVYGLFDDVFMCCIVETVLSMAWRGRSCHAVEKKSRMGLVTGISCVMGAAEEVILAVRDIPILLEDNNGGAA